VPKDLKDSFRCAQNDKPGAQNDKPGAQNDKPGAQNASCVLRLTSWVFELYKISFKLILVFRFDECSSNPERPEPGKGCWVKTAVISVEDIWVKRLSRIMSP
jgi:hypothetical protein